MTVLVRIRECYEHSEPNARAELLQVIKDEGGLMQVIMGWCEQEDIELLDIVPADTSTEGQK